MVIPVRDQVVAHHRPTEKLDCGVLLRQRQHRQSGRVGRPRRSAALGQVGRLAHPTPENQAGALQEVEHLRHRIGAIPGMQQRVGKPCLAAEIRGLAQQPRQGVILRQGSERVGQVPDLLLRMADPQPAAVSCSMYTPARPYEA